MMKIIKLFFTIISGILFISCQPEDGENGSSGINSLTVFSNEDPGLNCEYGGIRIDVGLDANSNLILEATEIENTRFVCGGINGPITTETRILLHSSLGVWSGTSGPYINFYPSIIKFDIRNWDNITSIIYKASIKTDNTNNAAIVDLYDRTNFRIINNSMLTTNSLEFVNVISDNLLDSFPDSEIDIHLRLRSENVTDDAVWLSNKAELIIRQEN